MGDDTSPPPPEEIGGSGSVSAGSRKPYDPPDGAAPGTEGGPDPAGMAPVKAGLTPSDSEAGGPHAGSGA